MNKQYGAVSIPSSKSPQTQQSRLGQATSRRQRGNKLCVQPPELRHHAFHHYKNRRRRVACATARVRTPISTQRRRAIITSRATNETKNRERKTAQQRGYRNRPADNFRIVTPDAIRKTAVRKNSIVRSGLTRCGGGSRSRFSVTPSSVLQRQSFKASRNVASKLMPLARLAQIHANGRLQ
jgi:hypothetical protein